MTSDRRDRARLGTDARPGAGARAARAVRARKPGRDPARPGCEPVDPALGRRRQAPPLPGSPAGPRRRLRDRLRPRRAARPPPRSDGRYDLAFRLKENRWNGTVAPQLVIRRLFDDARRLRGAARPARPALERGRDAWTAEARAIFAELELVDGAQAPALESEAFRALLARVRTRSGGLRAALGEASPSVGRLRPGSLQRRSAARRRRAATSSRASFVALRDLLCVVRSTGRRPIPHCNA